VWFRPLPWEARSGVTQMLSAAENILLLGLVLGSWRQIKQLPRALLRLPYVTYAVSYCLAFVFGFAAIGNFGILARQRTQGVILLFVVLCLPDLAAKGAAARFRDRASAAEAPDGRRASRGSPTDDGEGTDADGGPAGIDLDAAAVGRPGDRRPVRQGGD